MSQTLLETIEYFICHIEGDLEGISYEIREETNYSDNDGEELHEMTMRNLTEEWDYKNEHLQNLKKIKTLLLQPIYTQGD